MIINSCFSKVNRGSSVCVCVCVSVVESSSWRMRMVVPLLLLLVADVEEEEEAEVPVVVLMVCEERRGVWEVHPSSSSWLEEEEEEELLVLEAGEKGCCSSISYCLRGLGGVLVWYLGKKEGRHHISE